MAIEDASFLVWLGSAWLYCGAAVAVLFVLIGLGRVEENARGAYIFRPLIIPGILLLWPLVLWRWFVLETGGEAWRKRYRPPRAAHGRVWIALAIIIPAIFILSLAIRQSWPPESGAVQLEPPAR